MLQNTIDKAGAIAVDRIFGGQAQTPVPSAGTMLSIEIIDDLIARRDRLQIQHNDAANSEGWTGTAGLVGVGIGLVAGFWLL